MELLSTSKIEEDIVTRLCHTLVSKGYFLALRDEEGDVEIGPTRDVKAVLAEVLRADDEYLFVHSKTQSSKCIGWIRFVYGNDGWDVIADNTINLNVDIKEVEEYAIEKYA